MADLKGTMQKRVRLKNSDLTKAIIGAAVKLRSEGMCGCALGTERELNIGGIRYLAVVELHENLVRGKHHGISMFRLEEVKEEA